MVPTTSGWPEWPMSTISRPRRKWMSASRCTLVTSGQVASSVTMLRRAASSGTESGTPCAEKITGASPSGTSLSSSTKMAPFLRRLSTT